MVSWWLSAMMIFFTDEVFKKYEKYIKVQNICSLTTGGILKLFGFYKNIIFRQLDSWPIPRVGPVRKNPLYVSWSDDNGDAIAKLIDLLNSGKYCLQGCCEFTVRVISALLLGFRDRWWFCSTDCLDVRRPGCEKYSLMKLLEQIIIPSGSCASSRFQR